MNRQRFLAWLEMAPARESHAEIARQNLRHHFSTAAFFNCRIVNQSFGIRRNQWSSQRACELISRISVAVNDPCLNEDDRAR